MSRYRVALHRPLASWVVGSLSGTTTIADLATVLRIPRPVLADIVSYLVGAGMVLTGERGSLPQFPEDADPALIPWAQHDLLFHASSRMGRHNGPPDETFPQVDRLPGAVAKSPPLGTRFPLYRPPLATLASGDPSLSEVIETSRSHRDYARQALTADHIGELLFRAARIRWTRLVTAAVGTSYVVSDRPYPSTADLYELELYLTLDRCAGLPRGSYHYDPREHALTLISDSEPDLTELLDAAKVAAGSTQRPPVLITVTTRIARLSWRFSGIAYSTTLRHVGALQQTLHLVATAMGLASSALAVSDGATADDALRLDWPAEVSVGEFIVGTRT